MISRTSLLLVASAAFLPVISHGALVVYSFTGATNGSTGPFSPEGVATGVNASMMTASNMGNGTTGGVMSAFANPNDTSSPAYIFDGKGYSLNAGVTANDSTGPLDTPTLSTFTFTVTPTGAPITYTTLTLDFGSDLTNNVAINGTDFRFDLYYSIGGGALTQVGSTSLLSISSNTSHAVQNDLTKDLSSIPAFSSPVSGAVTFELRFGDNNSGAADKRIFIDDINVNGSVVPEPSSVLLLAGAAATLLRRSRKG
ncbi:PEP-CTERM sorting domain-containing protein [Luteolibacter sp. SL250]|uniref:PEP-CTERM sorting domain-containing protein n=1 Tax=Luteolibacter sp. SL250 TaxID=2995170 RepID=UPI0022711969|nr:PEP-CTERM sorting domain-containing protein [Luteolibacter sp. SL250]WAC21677.1 PEP-CTERM sorting domain-containing protein [Luteolibacter sp. SL250]